MRERSRGAGAGSVVGWIRRGVCFHECIQRGTKYGAGRRVVLFTPGAECFGVFFSDLAAGHGVVLRVVLIPGAFLCI